MYVSTGIPSDLVCRTHFAKLLSILGNKPDLYLVTVFFNRLLPEAERYASSLETMSVNDFRANVGRLNSSLTQRQAAETFGAVYIFR